MPEETSTVRVRLLFFAKTRELSGGDSEVPFEVARSDIVVSELLSQICLAFNLTTIKRSVILAVNERYCEDLEEVLRLQEGDEIAIIPPISGG